MGFAFSQVPTGVVFITNIKHFKLATYVAVLTIKSTPTAVQMLENQAL